MNSYNFQNLSGKIFIGYILDIRDPAGLGRKAVNIPNLLKSTISGEKYLFCKEIINTYIRTRDPLKSHVPYISYGSYQPLEPGTKVLVTFINNSLESGYIIGIDATVKTPHNKDEWLVYKTPGNSEFYVNDENGVTHIKNARGYSNVYLTERDILLQVNDVDPEGKGEDELIAQSYIQIGKDSIQFKIGDALYDFGRNGFTINTGEESATFIEVTKDNVNINANKNINISSDEGTIGINGQYTYVTGYNELHLFGSDARLTGSQKAQVSGTTVALWGWLDAHVKAMHVGIDAWLSLDTTSTIKSELNLALNYNASTINVNESAIDVLTTGLKSEASGVKAQDGLIISNLGIGTGVSSAIASTASTLTTSLKLIMATIDTALLLNDPFTGAANQMLTSTLAGSSNQALGSFATVFSGFTKMDNKNGVVTAIGMRKEMEEKSKKYILPDKLNISL